MIIYEKDTEDVHTLSIYKYKIVNNVLEYTYKDFDKWVIDLIEQNTENTVPYYYLIIDTALNDAFQHWVYESAIYLLLFIELKKTYPTIKLHIKTKKSYKNMICDYFGISNDDVVLELNNNNICIFPLPISAHNKKTISTDYTKQVDVFCNFIQSNRGITVKKHINILLMPRQSKENFAGNDRSYNVEDITNNISHGENNMILHTDSIKDFKEQIRIVNSSKNIILTGGSAYFVNGMISNNANIIVLDWAHHGDQIREYPKLKYIDYLVQMRNTVTAVHTISPFKYNDIKDYLEPLPL